MREEVEHMINNYNTMIREKAVLRDMVNRLLEISKEEFIMLQNFKPHTRYGAIDPGTIDRTGSIAVNYDDTYYCSIVTEINACNKQIWTLNNRLIFFESAMNNLSDNLPLFLHMYVVERLTWDVMCKKLNCSRTMLSRYRKKAINELVDIYTNYYKPFNI